MNQIDDKSEEGALQQAARATAAEPAGSLGHSAGIANAALSIPIADDLDPNAVGEFLLSIFNQSGRWGYSTHDFQRGNFREVRGLPPLIARTLCCGCWANTPGEGDRVQWWRSDEMGLDVFLYWDGDGTIVIQHRNWTLENSDCKKANEWEWVNLDHWSSDLPPGYYEDDAQGMETRQGGDGTAPSQDDSPVACDAPKPHGPITASLDAAMTLVPDHGEIDGRRFDLHNFEKRAIARTYSDQDTDHKATAATPALAIAAAALKARGE